MDVNLNADMEIIVNNNTRINHALKGLYVRIKSAIRNMK